MYENENESLNSRALVVCGCGCGISISFEEGQINIYHYDSFLDKLHIDN